MEMTKAAIYIAAAEHALKHHTVACYAIDFVSGQGYGQGEAYKEFSRLFKPEREVGPGWFGDVANPEQQEHRVLSLCMMAAITERK